MAGFRMGYNRSMSAEPLLGFSAAPAAAGWPFRAGEREARPRETDSGSAVEVEESRPELRPPPLYKVVLLNDDYTPMEFVVEVLQLFFRLDRNKATQIMLYVHTRGKGVAGVYTYEIAETKVVQVNEYSRKHQHPLLCTMEEA